MITLQIRYNESIHDHIEFRPGRYTIGRNPDCDLSIGVQDEEVSGQHAVITISEDSSRNSSIGTIRDMDSSFGTYLNGFSIQSTPLEVPLFYGDCLQFGKKAWEGRIVRLDATMTECKPEIEVTDTGDLYVRGRLINRADISPPVRSLLTEFKESKSEYLTHEQIYRACRQRNRPDGEPHLYSQQLVTELRTLLKERERYRGFLVENIHNKGYAMRRLEI